VTHRSIARSLPLGVGVAAVLVACSGTRAPSSADGDASLSRVDGSTHHTHDSAAPRDAIRPLDAPTVADRAIRDAGRSDAAEAHDAHDATSEAEAGGDASRPSRLVAYGSGYSPDIVVYSVDQTTGALTVTQSLAAFGTSPSFLAVNPALTRLYAVDENTTGRVGAYSIDVATGALTFLNAVSSGGEGPPFVSVDATGQWVFVANYTDGTVSVLPVLGDGSLGAATTTLTVGANAHMILADPSNKFVFVPCLGADYIAQFTFDQTTGALAPNAVAPTVAAAMGAGPRHIAFHPNGKFAYVINETNSTLAVYAFDADAGTLGLLGTQSTLPPGFTGTNTAAEVHVHPSGTWLLASNRGADDLAVFTVDPTTGALSAPTFTSSGGMTPRDFTIAPGGVLVYAANETTGNIVPFIFAPGAGTLAATASPVTVDAASFIGVIDLGP
jgi:6-phosphogluconolactonase